MESIRPQLAADIAESRADTASPLSAEQLRALAGVTRPQLLEDIATSMSTPDEVEDERF